MFGGSKVGFYPSQLTLDNVIQAINTRAQAMMGSGKYTNEKPPDPMALFALQNEVSSKANVFAFQKNFGMNAPGQQAKWGFDVFYESEGEEGETDCA
jgi:hypothetical protein